MKLTILAMILTTSFSFAATSYDLKCTSTEAYTDLGSAKLELNSKVTVNDVNDYVLEAGSFEFSIEDDWTDQNVSVLLVENKKDYRPRVYKQHAKFPNISTEFFGMVDFMIPHSALIDGNDSFTGVFILTWVEDHWGGTIQATCTLK